MATVSEIYNTKFIPVRDERGITENHVNFVKGKEGADRVLCVVPQLMAQHTYIIEATKRDGNPAELEKFDFSDCEFHGFTVDHEEVKVKPIPMSSRQLKFTVTFLSRGEYILKDSKENIVIMNVDSASAKHGVDAHLYYGQYNNKISKTKKVSKYIQKIVCVWGKFKPTSIPEREANHFPKYYEPNDCNPWPWHMNHKVTKIPKFIDDKKKKQEKEQKKEEEKKQTADDDDF
jgi:hypothetical protein